MRECASLYQTASFLKFLKSVLTSSSFHQNRRSRPPRKQRTGSSRQFAACPRGALPRGST
eukprot:3241478-Pleurochrysis_carterae.AAC.1